MIKLLNTATLISLYLCTAQSDAFALNPGHFILEAGGYRSTQGKGQQINIEGLIGDHFNVTSRHDTNGLIGLGYLLPGTKQSRFELDYGLNAFYLFKTGVKGTITQELMFTNLAYQYDVSHLPVYATAKARITTNSDKISIAIDAGVGPNFVNTSNYTDWSIDGGMTLPDHAFSGKTKTVFSATAGIGQPRHNI